MPRAIHDYEQDFLLVTPSEIRVLQATQCTQLDTPITACPHEDVWEWEASNPDGDHAMEGYCSEEYASVWERTLERL
jgi:hypothetical protein